MKSYFSSGKGEGILTQVIFCTDSYTSYCYMKGAVLWIFSNSPANWNHVWLLDIASDLINVTLVLIIKDCTTEEYSQLWEKLSKMVTNLFMLHPCNRLVLLTCVKQSLSVRNRIIHFRKCIAMGVELVGRPGSLWIGRLTDWQINTLIIVIRWTERQTNRQDGWIWTVKSCLAGNGLGGKIWLLLCFG